MQTLERLERSFSLSHIISRLEDYSPIESVLVFLFQCLKTCIIFSHFFYFFPCDSPAPCPFVLLIPLSFILVFSFLENFQAFLQGGLGGDSGPRTPASQGGQILPQNLRIISNFFRTAPDGSVRAFSQPIVHER